MSTPDKTHDSGDVPEAKFGNALIDSNPARFYNIFRLAPCEWCNGTGTRVWIDNSGLVGGECEHCDGTGVENEH